MIPYLLALALVFWAMLLGLVLKDYRHMRQINKN
jgi:hypothetical protein